MSDNDHASRRTVIKGAGLGLAAGALTPSLASAAGSVHQAATAEPVWSAEYWATKGDVKLYMWRKRTGAPKAGEVPRPVLFVVHGSSNSGRSSFDLTVPGRGEYSLMDVFARYGFDVWALDHDGYGRSGSSNTNSNIASGAEDLVAGTAVAQRETGLKKFHYFGESSGALRAAVLAMNRPDLVDRLVLSAFTYTGEGSPTLSKRAEQTEYYRTHIRRKRDRDMIRSIFTRDHPGSADPAVGEVLADVELALPYGDQVPTGTYLDMVANLPVVDPKRVQCPVLMLRGEYDGISTEADLLNFYRQLPNADKQYITLPGAAHALVFGINRHQTWYTTKTFLDMPPHQVV
ncbi:MAG: alpha/beta fold hydrolase [Alphaproteobacteria bacterium]|nr:alpha/beta fold hydrolase [Alphaproteobacteria bacterium]